MQQSVEKYADQGVTPGFRELLKHGARASDDGLMTQAPPNTGAGWFTLTTGAWPGVHGSTNNTFHKNGDPFGQTATHPGRTAAFDAGVLQAETLAQSAERGGKKVAQIEWAGGRGGAIDGPTVDFRGFFSGRGVATNYIAATDDAAFTASFGLQFDHPAGFAGQRAVPAGRTHRRHRLDQRAGLAQRRREGDAPARARRLQPDVGRQVRPQRLHLRQQERRPGPLRPRPLLDDQERQRQGRRPQGRRVGRRQGQAPDHQRAERQDRRVPGQGRAARRPTCRRSACSTPR